MKPHRGDIADGGATFPALVEEPGKQAMTIMTAAALFAATTRLAALPRLGLAALTGHGLAALGFGSTTLGFGRLPAFGRGPAALRRRGLALGPGRATLGGLLDLAALGSRIATPTMVTIQEIEQSGVGSAGAGATDQHGGRQGEPFHSGSLLKLNSRRT